MIVICGSSGLDTRDTTDVVILSVVQILAGNARKVSAVRFERLNHEDATVESKEVARLVPKIMKRKWSSDEGSDKTDRSEVTYQKYAVDDDLCDGNIVNEHEYDHEHPSKQ
ncbi:hypothetical protein U1Q18_000313 [Sarracenia purpurea var. burkii]